MGDRCVYAVVGKWGFTEPFVDRLLAELLAAHLAPRLHRIRRAIEADDANIHCIRHTRTNNLRSVVVLWVERWSTLPPHIRDNVDVVYFAVPAHTHHDELAAVASTLGCWVAQVRALWQIAHGAGKQYVSCKLDGRADAEPCAQLCFGQARQSTP